MCIYMCSLNIINNDLKTLRLWPSLLYAFFCRPNLRSLEKRFRDRLDKEKGRYLAHRVMFKICFIVNAFAFFSIRLK